MTLDHVTKINSVICPMTSPTNIIMYGRKKRISPKRTKLIENHVISGKFTSIKIQ